MNEKSRIKGILFDFDGVLAKSMEAHYEAWKKAMSGYGIKLTEKEYYPLEGMNVFEIARKFCNENNIDESQNTEIVQKKKSHFIENYKMIFYPGVETLIDDLKIRGIRMGIVTGGLREQLDKIVPQQFLQKFEVIITSEKGIRSKPSPEIYLRGLEELKLNPEECLVVENAPLGIKSAKEAGIFCIAIASTVSKDKLIAADEVVNSFSQLRKTKLGTIFQEL